MQREAMPWVLLISSTLDLWAWRLADGLLRSDDVHARCSDALFGLSASDTVFRLPLRCAD